MLDVRGGVDTRLALPCVPRLGYVSPCAGCTFGASATTTAAGPGVDSSAAALEDASSTTTVAMGGDATGSGHTSFLLRESAAARGGTGSPSSGGAAHEGAAVADRQSAPSVAAAPVKARPTTSTEITRSFWRPCGRTELRCSTPLKT